MSKGKILLIENSSADFYKARIPLYKYLSKEGYDVCALVPNDGFIEKIEAADVKVIVYELNRRDKGLIQLVKLIWLYRKIIKSNDFDLIHSFRFQPNLINVVANFFNRRKVILHITGLGIAFSNPSIKYVFLRIVSQVLFQLKLLRANKVVVQNEDDANDIWFGRLWKKRLAVIPGSGVDTTQFSIDTFNKQELRLQHGVTTQRIFICVTRLIWEKGIKEMVDAFELLHQKDASVRLWIVGWSDIDNPRHVDAEYINRFKNHPAIVFLGRQKDVRSLLATADVFLYPSYYREGIPRGILEALSMQLPVITTNMPGCKLTVRNGWNGFLITPCSVDAIVTSVEMMQKEQNLDQWGLNSRILAENKFSDNLIFMQIAELYKR